MGKDTKGEGKGQDFHTLAKPLPLSRVRGFCKGCSRVTFYLKSNFIWLQKLILSIEFLNFNLKIIFMTTSCLYSAFKF